MAAGQQPWIVRVPFFHAGPRVAGIFCAGHMRYPWIRGVASKNRAFSVAPREIRWSNPWFGSVLNGQVGTWPFFEVSILLLYLRIFSTSVSLRINVQIGMLIMALFYTATAGVAICSVIRCVGLASQTIQFCNTASGPVQLLNSVFNPICIIMI